MEKIVQIGKDRFSHLQREQVQFVDDEKTNVLLNDIDNNPHVYVLACLMDRQIKAEKAWAIPQRVFDILGTYKLDDLSKIPMEQITSIFASNKLHRFNIDMANIFYSGIQEIKNKYHGNASEIWQNNPSSAAVVFKFLSFKGCGIKIATMATNILARQFLIPFADYYSIDISPDVHIKRVLSRLGLVEKDPSPEMVIYKARELYPEFPGIIDFSCWEIGKTWCKPTNPDCKNCIVNSDCKKVLQ
jgi:endonuclease III